MLRPASAALLLTLSLIGCADDRRAERLKAAGPNPTLEKLMTVADAKAGARLFGTCAACHTSSAPHTAMAAHITQGRKSGPTPA